MEIYEIHPVATLFPAMSEEEYAGLKKDIAENGQREPITLWNGKLIDGRHRMRACQELFRQAYICELDHDQDPWSYVVSYNLHRRSLTTSQRAAIAAKMAKLRHGSNRFEEKVDPSKDGSTDANLTASVKEAAKLLNVSTSTVERAKSVQASGDTKLIEQMESGEITVGGAKRKLDERKKQATLPKESSAKAPAKQPWKPAATKFISALSDVDSPYKALCAILDAIPDATAAMVAEYLDKRFKV